MVVQTYLPKSQPPVTKKYTVLQKPSDWFRNLLQGAIPKVKRPNPQPTTIDRAINTLLTQMLFDASDIEASAILGAIIQIILTILETIQAQINPLETLTKVITKFKEIPNQNILSVSEPTLAAYVDTVPIKIADQALNRQLDVLNAGLKKQGIAPKEVALCIDPTDKIYRGKFHNRWTNWGITGQVATFKRAYKECGIYSIPTGLFVSSAPMLINSSNYSDRTPPQWLEQVRKVIIKYEERGVMTKLLIGDREYSTGIGMAYAYFGMFTPMLPLINAPRLISPMKGGEKEAELKWAFLLDFNAPQVVETSIQLGYYHAKYLGDRCAGLALNKKRDHYLLPIARVAAFDSYSNPKCRRTLEWAHMKATRIDKALAQANTMKEEAEKTYIAYQRQREDETCSAPKYSKKGRSVFKDPQEKPLYLACRACNNRVIHWQKQKEKLNRRLIFYNVSLHQGESLDSIKNELIALVEHYHERWGIEICFKGMKWNFNIRTNVRGTKARHVRKIMSGIAFNCWHVARLIRWSRIKKGLLPKWKPFNTQSPPIKTKYNGDLGRIGSAHSYLLGDWANQIKNSLLKQIQAM
jgi:hypothetical protein